VYADLEDNCPRGLAEPFKGPTVLVGNGIIQVSRRQFFQLGSSQLSGLGIDMTQPCYETPSLGHCEPSLVLQNLPSIVCGHVVNPQAGDVVLDMCAAPGGKTAHLACLLNGQGTVVALERSKKRVSLAASAT
jgi:16S rRNA C967 or C1407 C5-methylase (RsmB/RsmF family)